MKFKDKLGDSCRHYTTNLGCGKVYGLYRALYYELRGKDPKKWRYNLGGKWWEPNWKN